MVKKHNISSTIEGPWTVPRRLEIQLVKRSQIGESQMTVLLLDTEARGAGESDIQTTTICPIFSIIADILSQNLIIVRQHLQGGLYSVFIIISRILRIAPLKTEFCFELLPSLTRLIAAPALS
jgi:hypothetical protein